MARKLRVALLVPLLGQAIRSVIRHKARNALNALGVMIGIASVVWVVSIGEGAATTTTNQLAELGDKLLWIEAGARNTAGVRTGTLGAHTLTIDDASAILHDVPEIAKLSPQVDGSALVASEIANWTTRYRGVNNDYLDAKRWRLSEGERFTLVDAQSAPNVVLIGQTVRQKLFGETDAIGQIVRIERMSFVVVGVLAPKGQSPTGQDQDDTMFIPVGTVLRKLKGNSQIWLDDIVCSVVSLEAIPAATEKVTAILRERHRIGPDQEDDFNIRHPEELLKAQLEANRTFATLLTAIACVSLVVGGIGVMNVMLASVVERTREIGVRLAIGAPAWSIEVQFLSEAVMLTTLGGILGVVASSVGASFLAKLLGWPLEIAPQALIAALGFSLTTGLVFGFIPARRAARLDPIEALRSD